MKFHHVEGTLPTTSETSNQNIQPAKKQRSVPRLLDGRYYVLEADNDGKIEARCTNCGELRKGHINSTGNFLNHYRTKHASMMTDVEQYINRTNEVGDVKIVQSTIAIVGPAISKDEVRHIIININNRSSHNL